MKSEGFLFGERKRTNGLGKGDMKDNGHVNMNNVKR